MTTFLLIRHALTDAVGKRLVGRTPGVPLNAEGERQIESLATRLRPLPIDAIYSSPLQRARQTADAIARDRELPVTLLDGVTELDFGDWTGRTVQEILDLPAWQHFNRFRSGTRIPGGELILEAQSRMVTALERLHVEHGRSLVAIVSHGDPLRALLTYYLGMPLDFILRIEVQPASVSVVELEDYGVRVVRMNDTGGIL
jgi:probable phosphoglycerate mutase